MKAFTRTTLLLILLGIFCQVSEGCSSTRKCNGKRGTRVPMGIM